MRTLLTWTNTRNVRNINDTTNLLTTKFPLPIGNTTKQTAISRHQHCCPFSCDSLLIKMINPTILFLRSQHNQASVWKTYRNKICHRRVLQIQWLIPPGSGDIMKFQNWSYDSYWHFLQAPPDTQTESPFSSISAITGYTTEVALLCLV